jgi:translation initiation factor IF-3
MKVTLIGDDGKRIGEVDIEEARKIATEKDKNLVKVSAKGNVYRIADAGKLMYEKKQKEKKLRAQRRTHKVKEIKIGLNTNDHDLNVKLKRIIGFIEKGMKTKVTLQLKGRQRNFRDAAMSKMKLFLDSIIHSVNAEIDKVPKLEGNRIIAFIKPHQ